MIDEPVMYIVVHQLHDASLDELLVSAAGAVRRVLLTMPGDHADAWRAGLYRKVTLRADDKAWATLDGIPHCEGDNIVRVFPPMPRGARPKALARLQTYNATAEELHTQPERKGHPWAVTIVVNDDVPQSVGKLVAQVGHAAMFAVERYVSDAWRETDYAFALLHASGEAWAEFRAWECAVVTDAGLTEVAGGSETCLVLPPVTR